MPNAHTACFIRYGEQRDEDGVDVIASLNIDNKGNLFELDIWKTDFSRLLKFPDL